MYQALYRKWRPKTFDQVVGQQHITETLKNQIISGRLSHAYLFIGTRGTGKTTCAKILAKALNCQHPENGNPCGKCPACLGIDDGSILDVVEIDAASNNGVDNVRQLREEAVFSPVSVKKRVYIIDEVHMLSTAAFNALLKILEEPPEHLTFILATTELNKVPATILSRCQRHSFKRLDSDVIAKHLEYIASQEHFDLDAQAARLIAGLAEGGMRDALSLLDQCSGAEHIDVDTVYDVMGLTGNRRTAKLLDCTVRQNTQAALELFTELWNDGKDPATLLGELNTLQRDCLMLSVAPKAKVSLLSGGYDAQTLAVFTKKLTCAELINRIDIVSDYLMKIKDAKSPKLTAELCLISLCDPALNEGMNELRARISRLEADIKNGVSIVAAPAKAEKEEVIEEIPFGEPPEMPEPEYEEPVFDEPEEDIPPADLNPDASAESASAPADNASLWQAIVEKADEELPAGIIALLSDSTQAKAEISYDSMSIFVAPGFAYNMVNRQDTIIRLRAAAQEVTGRSLKIQILEMTNDSSTPPRSIEELKKFKETRFI